MMGKQKSRQPSDGNVLLYAACWWSSGVLQSKYDRMLLETGTRMWGFVPYDRLLGPTSSLLLSPRWIEFLVIRLRTRLLLDLIWVAVVLLEENSAS